MIITLKEAAEACNGIYKGDGSTVLNGLFTDSRTPVKNGLYVSLIG